MLLWSIFTRLSRDVRLAATASIHMTKLTVAEVFARLRDTSKDVRAVAAAVLATKVRMRELDLAQRCQVLRAVLQDREANVRAAGGSLVTSWLATMDWNVLDVRAVMVHVSHRGTHTIALAAVLERPGH